MMRLPPTRIMLFTAGSTNWIHTTTTWQTHTRSCSPRSGT
jgi:hypothetical protein